MRAPDRILLAAAAALALAAPLGAQAPASGAVAPDSAGAAALPEDDVYRREVFRYQAGGRPDPFRPLLQGEDMGVRVQDLQLVGIIHSSSARASMAVFNLPGDQGRVRLRVGQRLGSVTVTAIHPRRVDVREDALGVSRAYSLELQRPRRPVATEGAASSAPAVAAPPSAVGGAADRARQAQPGQTPVP